MIKLTLNDLEAKSYNFLSKEHILKRLTAEGWYDKLKAGEVVVVTHGALVMIFDKDVVLADPRDVGYDYRTILKDAKTRFYL